MKLSWAKTAVAALLAYDLPFVGAATAATCPTGMTPAQMVTNINVLTNKSQALQPKAQSITVVNGLLIAVGSGPFPAIIAGFADIVSTVGVDMVQMQGTPAVTNVNDANAIFDAFRQFVAVHQALLNILIGKAGLFNTVPLIGQPVAAVLRQIEMVVDAIAYNLINLVQSRATDLQNQANGLHSTVETAIKSYNGVSTGSVVKKDLDHPKIPRALRV